AGVAGTGDSASEPAWARAEDYHYAGSDGSPAGLVVQGWCDSSCTRLDLARELALLVGQSPHTAGQRAECLQRAAQLNVGAALQSHGGESTQQLGAAQRPQLAAERFRCRDQQVAELAESRAAGVDRALARRHQRTQRLSLAAGTRLGSLALREHAPCCPDRVERVALAARTPFAPQAPHLEH